MATRTDRLLLANALIGNFLGGLGARIFSISLPTIANALNADILGISWAIISYQLASISLSVVFGRLGDIYGRHKIYGAGFVFMTAFSLLCGVSTTISQLILFRFLQGFGAAMASSAARVMAMEAMPEGSEGKANGFMTIAFHGGLLVGPPVGGVIIDYVSWRWIFFLLVPFGVAGMVLTVMRLKQPTPAGRRQHSVDYIGAALLIVVTVILTLTLDRRAAELVGAGRQSVLALLLLATLAGFVAQELHAADPIVNFALFRIRMFSFSTLSLFVISLGYSILLLLMPFYLQEVLHLSPSILGVIFLASPILTISLASMSGYLTDRIGPRVPASIGVAMMLAAFVIGTVLRVDSHWALPTFLMALLGLGSGFFNTPNQTAIIGSVPREYRGFATGMIQTMFGLGQLLGISLGGALLTVAFQYYSGIPGASPDPANRLAFVSSMNATYVVCAAMTLVALFASLLRGGAKIEAARSTM